MPESKRKDSEPVLHSSASSSKIDWWTMFTDPKFLASPYAELNRIREIAPIQKDPVSGVYFVLGHPEFRRMATAPEMGRDTRLWSNGWSSPENSRNDPLSYELFSTFQPQMTNANPPDHRRMRDVYEKAFRQTDLQVFRPMIEEECRALAEAVPGDTPLDFMEAVANPLARNVSRKAFQIPVELDEDLTRWVAALSLVGNIMMSADQKRDALTALTEFRCYLRERIATGIDDPGDGFVGLTMTALADGVMDEDEGLNNLVTLISGGIAIATLVGNGLLALLRHPDQFEKLRQHRELLRPAIEEMLRYEPGGSFILRVAIEDYRCGEVLIPAGSLAIGLVAATGRDPRTFEQPDRFEIARKANPHIVFGAGAHICIGKALVRMTAMALFETLMDRFERIDLAGDPVWWTHRSDQHGLHTLPVKLGNAR
ncbi:cytochrome P450 [Roseibium aggregatum]|uniref:Cytochrome P450 n=1 Tax=Roseibium aggregatum TaxID=187304 RepID=A0A939EBJ5_9HYPH|nr:cytochrome P450 [Roseibium aggregatum]MBN9669592.1 cytochrome P450 [Roseibium aggregatum]